MYFTGQEVLLRDRIYKCVIQVCIHKGVCVCLKRYTHTYQVTKTLHVRVVVYEKQHANARTTILPNYNL